MIWFDCGNSSDTVSFSRTEACAWCPCICIRAGRRVTLAQSLLLVLPAHLFMWSFEKGCFKQQDDFYLLSCIHFTFCGCWGLWRRPQLFRENWMVVGILWSLWNNLWSWILFTLPTLRCLDDEGACSQWGPRGKLLCSGCQPYLRILKTLCIIWHMVHCL